MGSVLRMIAVALSLASLLLIEVWRNVVQVRSPQSLYLTIRPAAATLEIAALLNTIFFASLIFVLFWFFVTRREKGKRRGFYVVPAILGGAAFWILTEFLLWECGAPLFRALCLLIGPVAGLYVPVVLVYVLFPAFVGAFITLWPRKAWNTIERIAWILFPFALICLVQTSWQAIRRPAIVVETRHPSAVSGGQTKSLVLWLMFDEMDQSTAFGEGPGKLDLPNLAALRQTAIHGDRACEAADLTARAIPAYTIGQRVKNVRWDSASDLMLRFEGSDTFVPWTHQRTVFHDAAAVGRRTAILGYFHPYCRLFGKLATVCEEFHYSEAGDLMKWWNTLQNQPLHTAVWLQAERALPGPAFVRRFDGERFKTWQLAVLRNTESEHAKCLSDVRHGLLKVLADRSIDFVFCHIPLPHPPALLYSLQGDVIKTPGYLSDLRAGDQLFGEIKQVLSSTGRWDEAAVIVTSDHTVRDLWSNTLFLSPSLETVIQTMKERTVPFLVKLPHQRVARAYADPFNAILVHGVVQQLLKEEFRGPEDVLDYLRQNASSSPCPARQ